MSVEVQQIDLEAAQFKADAMVQTGLRMLEFYAAAFSKTPDSNGDIIDPHAFDGWLQAFYAAGKPLPLSFSHSAVLDSLDPTNVIGYAPADPQHVWVDGYGLRVSGFIDTSTEKGKAVEWQIENHLLGGASIAYKVPVGGRVKQGDAFRIKTISEVREAGPTPNPANQEAVLLWMKSEHLIEAEPDYPYMTVEEFRTTFFKTVDTSTWDKNTALGACSTAAQYGEICAAVHTVGQPDERQHYALPHHYLGKGPNEDGVKAALARVGQVQQITDAERANGQNHLEAHMKEINPDYQPPKSDETEPETKAQEPLPADTAALKAHLEAAAPGGHGVAAASVDKEPPAFLPNTHKRLHAAGNAGHTHAGLASEESVPEVKHQASPAYIQSAHDALVRAGAKCAEPSPVQQASDDVASRLRRLRFMKTSLT